MGAQAQAVAVPSQAASGSARRHYGFSAKTVMVGFPPPISGASW
jgi:hypothetical protein